MRGQDFGTPFTGTTAGTASSITLQTGTTNRIHFVTDISGTMDALGVIEVRDGSTVLWQDRLSATTGTVAGYYSRNFSTPIRGTAGSNLSVYVGTATTVSFVNVAGYYLP